MRTSRFATATIALAVLGGLTACASGSSEDAAEEESTGDAVTVTLQWVIQAQFAGFIAAADQGYYEDEGIDLTINPGGPDVNNIQLLLSGDTDIAVQSFGNVLSSVDQGADLVAIGALHERPGATLVYYTDKGDYSDPANWGGLTVGNWNGFSPSFFAAAAKNGYDTQSDLTIANQAFDMNAFISDEFDLAEAMTYNEYAQALAGSGDREIGIVDYNELGVATLEDTIVTTPEWLDENGDLAERFLRATAQGWVYCRDNPEECVGIVLEYGTALPETYQLWQMNEISKLMWPSTEGLLAVPDALITQTGDILQEYEVIENEPDSSIVDFGYRDEAVADMSEEDLYGADFQPLDLDPQELFATE